MKARRQGKGILLGAALAITVLAAAGCSGAGKAEAQMEMTAGEQWPVTLAEEEHPDEGGRISGSEQFEAAGDTTSATVDGKLAGAEGGLSAPATDVIPIKGQEEADTATSSAVPKLPSTGKQLSDFVPDRWTLLDSVTLDFNKDGVTDYVAVLESQTDPDTESLTQHIQPRILFAAASDGAGQYRLDFEDTNLIRTVSEGGPFGDPYMPMSAQGQSFTINSYGGSSWKWSDSDTYTYKNRTWYLTEADHSDSFSSYITGHSIDDYVKGSGIRHKRSGDTEDIEKNLLNTDWDNPSYDLTYEVKLNPPITLHQAGMRSIRYPKRQMVLPVEDIWIAEGMDQKETPVMLPEDQDYFRHQDEDCLLYSYMNPNDEIWYLALYGRTDRILSVIAQEQSPIEDIIRYKDNIYYTAEIKGPVVYKLYNGTIRESEEQIGMKLLRISMDGTDSREIFSYELPEWQEGVREASPPFMYLSTEISGDEIITEVSIEGRPHPFYRMNLDGSGLQMIGTVPKE